MPLKKYGVLLGKATDSILASSSNEHFQIKIDASGKPYRIAINVKSAVNPPEVLFYMDEDFQHPILQDILDKNLAAGFTEIPSQPNSIALDFIRRNMFPTAAMKPIPFNKPGADNDLNEKVGFYVSQAISDSDARVYAFGERWGPEPGVKDKYFGFEPGNGIHDIHMNQGNSGQYKKDNGVYQDGGLFIHFPSRNKWVAIFIAFQVQAWHTDDKTGDPITGPPVVDPDQPESSTPVRIIAAMVNPRVPDVGNEYVILLNTADTPVNLQGWKIVDKSKTRFDTLGNLIIPGGDALRVPLSGQGAQLSNDGGIITLLNKQGLKVDGVTYTKTDAAKTGLLVVF
ncbi:Uncharacterized protein YukJ [Chryseolinea serpens]|uniref:Uncharacterized protein YukJ n=1 Tax=Chryseolinea serpens TaxID=947013 RepID=A0A1M5QR94_9BACT|nr:DUF2278 family protein [Chryseolinea serpens]SHH16113.1 Uncharacterized protein YukJ [Chryseolinea serpens]